METPRDPFEESEWEGLDEALESVDPAEREVLRAFAAEIDRAQLDAAAIMNQPNFLAAWTAMGALDDTRVRAVMFWFVSELKRALDPAGHRAWMSGPAE